MTAEPRGRDRAWTVAEVAAAVRGLVEDTIGQRWIKGEVSGLKVYQSGHWYFTLRDPDAQIRCVMWRTYTERAGTPPAEGTEVFVLATPTVWEERGEFRLRVVVMLPTATVGAQEAARARTRAALERDGLLDSSRRRSLPPYPRAIAVVTSLDGAVLHDILTVRRARWPAVRLLVIPSKVQGDEAERELVRALARVGRLDVDACILARGGGAREELSPFDAEAVCRAVAAVPVPVITAVGHETDVTLVDLVADVRAATPSQAAELALPSRTDVLRHTNGVASRLAQGLTRRSRLVAERLARTGDRLDAAVRRRLERKWRDVDRIGGQLEALSPLRVLERGYAVARGEDGQVLRRRQDFPAGRPFSLRLQDGSVRARTEEAS